VIGPEHDLRADRRPDMGMGKASRRECGKPGQRRE